LLTDHTDRTDQKTSHLAYYSHNPIASFAAKTQLRYNLSRITHHAFTHLRTIASRIITHHASRITHHASRITHQHPVSMKRRTMPSRPRIHFVATGGTIAMRIDQATGGAVPALTGAELTEAVPGLQLIGQIDVEEFANIPSEHMQPEFWLRLARRIQDIVDQDSADGVVVLHGTDIMEETAFFLDVTVPTSLPIVFTGAMRSAATPRLTAHPTSWTPRPWLPAPTRATAAWSSSCTATSTRPAA
jgi:hypothetical protein